MPEGHSIHRYAQQHTADLAGRPLRAWSPQGRFREGAGVLDGRVLETVEAHGKHLFYHWQDGICLHVHLGLFGVFRRHHGPPPPATAQTRLAVQDADGPVTVYLAGPSACELLAPAGVQEVRSRLGPDPLASPGGSAVFAAALRRRRSPIGAVLLDQRVIAGVGNAFRAEALFLCGLHPERPSADLEPDEVRALWRTIRRLLRAGLRTGEIHTVAGGRRGAGPPARYVYRRDGEPCRRCQERVASWSSAGRRVFACPSCQPVAPGAAATAGSP